MMMLIRTSGTRLDGLGQLLGDALGDLAQLAQRPIRLQPRQRAAQRADWVLLLAVVLRRQRHLRARTQTRRDAAPGCTAPACMPLLWLSC